MTWLLHQNVVFLAFLAGLFTWGCTIVGSAIVFFFKNISRKLQDIMMGFAVGVHDCSLFLVRYWLLLWLMLVKMDMVNCHGFPQQLDSYLVVLPFV